MKVLNRVTLTFSFDPYQIVPGQGVPVDVSIDRAGLNYGTGQIPLNVLGQRMPQAIRDALKAAVVAARQALADDALAIAARASANTDAVEAARLNAAAAELDSFTS